MPATVSLRTRNTRMAVRRVLKQTSVGAKSKRHGYYIPNHVLYLQSLGEGGIVNMNKNRLCPLEQNCKSRGVHLPILHPVWLVSLAGPTCPCSCIRNSGIRDILKESAARSGSLRMGDHGSDVSAERPGPSAPGKKKKLRDTHAVSMSYMELTRRLRKRLRCFWSIRRGMQAGKTADRRRGERRR